MSLQEIHKIPLTYQHWANKIDERDFRTAGPMIATIGAMIPIPNATLQRDILNTYLDPKIINEIGFVNKLQFYTDANPDAFRIYIDGELHSTGRMGYSDYLSIKRIFPIIDVYHAQGTTRNYTFQIEYIIKSKYNPDSPGQDSPVDSGPAAGVDMVPTVSPDDTEGMTG